VALEGHTGAEEAAAITRTAAEHAPEYLAPIAGRTRRMVLVEDLALPEGGPEVFDAACSWVELATTSRRSSPASRARRTSSAGVCAAGHKAMYSDTWGGLPSKAFLARLDPKLADLRGRLYDRAHAADRPAGRLCAEWAAALGLREGIAIAMGEFDAHYGAVGAGARTGTLVKIIGTSTCDCAVVPVSGAIQNVPGICGIVNGSILPGYYGIEAGQSAVGDLLKWWVERVCEGDESAARGTDGRASRLKPGSRAWWRLTGQR